jgi:hypothetical protein
MMSAASATETERGSLVASLLQGAWRAQPNSASLSQKELELILPILVRSGTAGLAWRRIRDTPLALTEAGGKLRLARRIQAAEAAIRVAQIEQVLSKEGMREADPIVIKGWAHGGFYPEAGLRHYTDIDLVVQPARHQAASLAVATMVPTDPGRAIPVDIQDNWKDLPDRSWEELLAHSRLLSLPSRHVKTLGYEDTLRLSCLHLLRHLGFHPLWLCDISALLENLPAEFDWDYCLSGQRRRTEWMLAAIRLAHQVLGARLERCPERRLPREVPRWMLRAMLRRWGAEATFEYPWPLPRQIGAVVRADPRKFPQALADRWPDPLSAIARFSWPINRVSGKAAQILDFGARALTWAHRQIGLLFRPLPEGDLVGH